MNNIDFDGAFEKLTGNPPFPWLTALYERFVSNHHGSIPSSCIIPTGLGKTSVIAVWLIGLANHPEKLPRRLVYVVNRRTVVDQTTTVVENIRENLGNVPGLNQALWNLCAAEPSDEAKQAHPELRPLAISTLRGQFADNREWSADPFRPAVICGTVDMIGSRLLFNGYGVGFKQKPLHAGFLGQNVLLIHDEAHLEPAFQMLIERIADEQRRESGALGAPLRLQVLELTATSRTSGSVFTLTPADEKDPRVQQRVRAKKHLLLHVIKEDETAEKVAELALQHGESGKAVLVFLRRLEDVDKARSRLAKQSNLKVQTLTGTMRGHERDKLATADPVFLRFLPPSARPQGAEVAQGTAYLVCTSAGEVGVNISADHLVCDLSTFESMAQRFGRVNRFGECQDTQINVVFPAEFKKDDDLDQRRERTLHLLQLLNGDASPAALGSLDPAAREAAFAPEPTILPAPDIVFDSWALTSIRGKLPGRPPVEPYLHGISGWQPPETHVAWREEVGLLTDDILEIYPPEALLEDYPLKPHELLRDRSDRVFKHLLAIAERHGDDPAWLLDDDGTVQRFKLSELADKDQKDRINYQTILLPPSVGGLTPEGMLEGKSPTAADVADLWLDEHGHALRCRNVWNDDPAPVGMQLIRTIDTQPDSDEDEDQGGRRFWHWFEVARAGNSDLSRASRKPVHLHVHTTDVVSRVTDFVSKTAFPEDLRNALILAARLHDLGKARRAFQRCLGNYDSKLLLAKSDKRAGRMAEMYRHEFGSLLDAHRDAEFSKLGDDLKDLVLHLIAAHHGRGRPHFSQDESFDPEPDGQDITAIAAEVPRRFARLQRKYGRWGLAYLESLLRAADYAASANPSAFVEDKP